MGGFHFLFIFYRIDDPVRRYVFYGGIPSDIKEENVIIVCSRDIGARFVCFAPIHLYINILCSTLYRQFATIKCNKTEEIIHFYRIKYRNTVCHTHTIYKRKQAQINFTTRIQLYAK